MSLFVWGRPWVHSATVESVRTHILERSFVNVSIVEKVLSGDREHERTLTSEKTFQMSVL